MNGQNFNFRGETLTAFPSGALWWAEQSVLVVSDLHLGKSERMARRGGAMLPPFDTQDTISRLQAAIDITQARTVICLGDSFDDMVAANSLDESAAIWLTRLQAGRQWIWIEGNHDPGPLSFGGTHLAEYSTRALTFRHIADEGSLGEVSGHYHPKTTIRARGRSITRPCFVYDDRRVVLPAFGTYTGGLRTRNPVLSHLMGPEACAILTGKTAQVVPMPRC